MITCSQSMVYVQYDFSIQVTRPTPDWGPGDKNAKNEWIRYKQTKAMEAMTCKRHPHAAAYDNYAMSYPVGYYTTPGPTYHM